MQVKNQQLEPDMKQWTGSKLLLLPGLFKLHAEYIMQNARLDEAKAGIKIAGSNINNLRYADDTTIMAERKEELKSLCLSFLSHTANYRWLPILRMAYYHVLNYFGFIFCRSFLLCFLPREVPLVFVVKLFW